MNATFGAHAVVGLTTFTNGVSFPVTQSDRVYDWEYRFLVNRHY